MAIKKKKKTGLGIGEKVAKSDWPEEGADGADDEGDAQPPEAGGMGSDKGIATIMDGKSPVLTITLATDGTFGWRTHGKLMLKGRGEGRKLAYKFKKGFESFQVASAAALCFYGRQFPLDADAIEVADYFPPSRSGSGRKLVDTEEFAAALKVSKAFKLPASVKRAIA